MKNQRESMQRPERDLYPFETHETRTSRGTFFLPVAGTVKLWKGSHECWVQKSVRAPEGEVLPYLHATIQIMPFVLNEEGVKKMTFDKKASLMKDGVLFGIPLTTDEPAQRINVYFKPEQGSVWRFAYAGAPFDAEAVVRTFKSHPRPHREPGRGPQHPRAGESVPLPVKERV